MKILYLTDPFRDFLADQLYYGLCKLLGPERVIDYPYKAIYHDPQQKEWYLPQVPGVRYEEADILDLLAGKEVDLVILSSPRRANTAALSALAARAKLPPAVLLDGEDDRRIRRDLFRRFGFRLYFKREYDRRWTRAGWARLLAFRGDRELIHRTFPLPFSIIPEAIPPSGEGERDIDVFFAARLSNKRRVRAWAILERLEGVRLAGGLFERDHDRIHPLGDEGYYRALGRAKIGISIRGGGFDTLRYWEIVACRALLLSESPDIIIPNNFRHQHHAIFCRNDLSDLKDLVHHYLRNETERQRIARAGHEHFISCHSAEKRATYFFDVCNHWAA